MPERFVPTLGVVVDPRGDLAVVLLGTDGDDPYPHQVVCHREDDGWREGTGGNGCGWSSTTWDEDDDVPNVGVSTLWDEAPAGATAAVIAMDGAETTVPVRNGFYLFAAWDIPDEEIDGRRPRLVRFIR